MFDVDDVWSIERGMKHVGDVSTDRLNLAKRELLRAGLSLEGSVAPPDLTPTTDATNMVMRIRGRFGGHDADAASGVGFESWGALPLIFAIGALSFVDAGPREDSKIALESDDACSAIRAKRASLLRGLRARTVHENAYRREANQRFRNRNRESR